METPALTHLMGAYYHQDWVEDGLDDRATIHAFMRGTPPLASRLVEEIEQVLTLDEAEVDGLLERLGCEVDPSPSSNGSYRTWLTELAGYAREVSSPDQPGATS